MLLRSAKPADADAVAGVHMRSWHVAHRGLLPDKYLDRLRPEDRAEQYTFGDLQPHQPATIVAIEREVICGFAPTGPSRHADRQRGGELYALYVDTDCLGVGVGRGADGGRSRSSRDTVSRRRACGSSWVTNALNASTGSMVGSPTGAGVGARSGEWLSTRSDIAGRCRERRFWAARPVLASTGRATRPGLGHPGARGTLGTRPRW